MKCPRCGECPYPNGVCERVASRGRRFFLMGALALPVALAIERVKPIVAPQDTVVIRSPGLAIPIMLYKFGLDGEWQRIDLSSLGAWTTYKAGT